MEDMKSNPAQTLPAATKLASDEELKAKYGKVYRMAWRARSSPTA